MLYRLKLSVSGDSIEQTDGTIVEHIEEIRVLMDSKEMKRLYPRRVYWNRAKHDVLKEGQSVQWTTMGKRATDIFPSSFTAIYRLGHPTGDGLEGSDVEVQSGESLVLHGTWSGF